MKIAHVTPYFDPEYYGSHEAFLSAELARRGHQVTLFTSDRMPRWGGARGIHRRLPLGESLWRGVRIVRIPAGPTLSFVPSLPSLPRHLRQGDYDLFLSHEVFSLAAWHSARAARRADRPFVLIQHGYTGGRRLAYRLLFQAEFRTLGRRVLHAADSVVTLTGAGQEFLASLGAPPEKVHVIPTGVDCARFQAGPRNEQGPLRFGFLGRMDRDKGVALLVEAFQNACRIEDQRPVQLVMAGAGDLRAPLERQVQGTGWDKQVRFLGRLPHGRVPSYLASLDALVVPTLLSEPFGIVAVEAAAAGVPVLASGVGGLRETVEDGVTGRLLEPGNRNQLEEVLLEGIRHPEHLRRLGQAARQRALTHYDWPKITGRFESLFENAEQAAA